MPPSPRYLLVRADAGPRIGSGHVMRCLALAQAWRQRGGEAAFLTAGENPRLQKRLQTEGIEVARLSAEPGSTADARETVAQAQDLGAAWLVADGYHFDAAYQKAIKKAGLSLLCLDDNGHADHYCADWVLNQNIHASPHFYHHREPFTHLLLGWGYFLLRREFLKWRLWSRPTPRIARNLLVTLGGSDPDNVTLKVLQALELVQTVPIRAVVVVGGGNPHRQELQAAAQQAPFPVTLKYNVADMPELMASVDMAISAGGVTCGEMAFMQLPALVLAVADNQRREVERLGQQRVAESLDWHKTLEPEHLAERCTALLSDTPRRECMGRRGRELIDGDGAARTVAKLLDETATPAQDSERAQGSERSFGTCAGESKTT